MSLRGPAPDGLGEERHADAHQLAALALLLLLGAQRVVADHVHGQAHGGLVVARVVHPAGLGLVRKLVGLQQVPQPQLRPGPSSARSARQSTSRSTKYTASVMRNEQAYATPPGALLVYTAVMWQ